MFSDPLTKSHQPLTTCLCLLLRQLQGLDRQRYEPPASPRQLQFKDTDFPATPATPAASAAVPLANGSPATPTHNRQHSGSRRFPSFSKNVMSLNKTPESPSVGLDNHTFEIVNRHVPSLPGKTGEAGAGSFRRRISAVFHADRPGGKTRRASLVGSINKPTADQLTPTPPVAPATNRSLSQMFHNTHPSS